MDYSKLSDFEINLQVNRALGMKHYPNEEKQIVEVFGDVVIFDPCNNPADAWTIIANNEISIIFNWNEEGLHGATTHPWISSENTNPLRAAMECFLMMQESANVPVNSTGSDIR